MPRSFQPHQEKLRSDSLLHFLQPVEDIIPEIPVLASRGDKPLKMTFDDQLKMLIFYHLEARCRAALKRETTADSWWPESFWCRAVRHPRRFWRTRAFP